MPLQEGATEVFNSLLGVAQLNGQPPLAYDRNDANLAAGGGPRIFPGAQLPTDSPNAIEALQIGDLNGLLNAYLALLKQHEDVTGVNDARRGQSVKSHTTATAADIEANQGLSRTDDFVSSQEQGPLTTMLYMEYAIIKTMMKSPQPVAVETGGIEGFIKVAASDLADTVQFTVQGSAGVANERERARNFLAASQFAVTMQQAALQQQIQIPINFQEIIVEVFNRAGVQNAGRFIGGSADVPAGPESGPNVQGSGNGGSPIDVSNLPASGNAGI